MKTIEVASLDVDVISLSLLIELRAFSRGRVTFDSRIVGINNHERQFHFRIKIHR
jgi:hypothetical protein